MKTFLALCLGCSVGFYGGVFFTLPASEHIHSITDNAAYECGFLDGEGLIIAGATGKAPADLVQCREYRDRSVKAGFGQFSRDPLSDPR